MTRHYLGLGSASHWLKVLTYKKHCSDLGGDASLQWNSLLSFQRHDMQAIFVPYFGGVEVYEEVNYKNR